MTRVDEDDLGMLDEEPRHRFGRRDGRWRVWVVVGVLVVVPLTVLSGVALWFWWQLDPPGAAGEKVEMRIDGGWSVSRIGEELADRDIIGSATVFHVYSRLSGKNDFQAGTYDLRRNMGVRDAVSTLQQGPRIDYVQLAAPPGKWLVEIADLVDELPDRTGPKFLESTRNGSARSKYKPEDQPSMEGLLWPDTYRVSEGEDEIDVLTSMVQNFDSHADALGLGAATTEGRTPYEILVVASLIEAEAKVDSDRPLIASVIYNRLRRDMPLQIDATVLYASGDPTKQTITIQDLDLDSPYNTYKNNGLPPTPIATVTEKSLEAAIHPASTEFLYYVIADKDGRHAFAETFDVHEENIAAAQAAGLL